VANENRQGDPVVIARGGRAQQVVCQSTSGCLLVPLAANWTSGKQSMYADDALAEIEDALPFQGCFSDPD